jgi:outer membrane protein assembly factor BamB
MPDRIRAVDCPSCGAPLELPAEPQRLFKCNFCGTVLEDLFAQEDQDIGQPPKVIIHTTAVKHPPLPRQTSSTTQLSRRTGYLVWAFVIGIILVSVGVPLFLSGALSFGGTTLSDQIESARIYSFGPTRLLPSDDGSQPDIVGITSNADDTDRMIYVDFEADPQLRWRSEPLGEGAIYTFNHIVASEAAVFMAYKTTLVAFGRIDGTILWQREISDEVSNICQDCLQVFGNGLVALTADGILTCYNTQTGEPTWNVRLNETPRQLLNLGGKVSVLDKEDDLVGIHIYSQDTGALLQRLLPECPNEIFPSSPQTLGIYDKVLLSFDGKRLYVPIASYDPGCLQTWDTVSLTQTDQVSIPQEVLDNFDWEPYLLTEEMLYLSDGHNLYAIDLRNGNYLTVYSSEDHDLIPISAQDGLLLAVAERTRGTQKYFLWGLDVSSQTKLWEFEPAAEDLIEDDSFTVYEEGGWSANLITGVPVVLEAFTNPAVLEFSILDPADGSLVDQDPLEISDMDYTYWAHLIVWQGENIYLAIDGRLWWIDALTGTEVAAWP